MNIFTLRSDTFTLNFNLFDSFRYVSDFEDHLLVSTREYYMRKSQSYLHTDDTPSYMIKAEAALDAERERVHAYVGDAVGESL